MSPATPAASSALPPLSIPDLPTGTVTFLFTDIEGSTRLWEEHPETMRAALLQHDDLLRACIESHGGCVFKTVGDAFCAVFANPRGAVETVIAPQQWLPALALQTPDGARPLKVRMALHTGIAEEEGGKVVLPLAEALAHGYQPQPEPPARPDPPFDSRAAALNGGVKECHWSPAKRLAGNHPPCSPAVPSADPPCCSACCWEWGRPRSC